MDNQDIFDPEELDETQEFDLDAILNEFHTDHEDAPPEDAPAIAPETGDSEAFDQELSQILQDFGEEPGEEQPSSLSETRIFSPAPSDAEKAAAAPGTAPSPEPGPFRNAPSPRSAASAPPGISGYSRIRPGGRWHPR